jgi:uncharacterized iron-regulated protein
MTHASNALWLALSAAILTSLTTACGDSSPSHEKKALETGTTENISQSELTLKSEDLTQSAAKQAVISVIQQLFSESINASQDLAQHTEAFTKKPNEQNYQELLNAWQKAHQQYRLSQTSHIFNIEHPSFDESVSAPHHTLDSRIDSFPLLPGYLDQVEGYPNSGLIYSEVDLSIEVLQTEHLFSDPAYVTLGFHAFDTVLQGDLQLSIKPWQRFATTGVEIQDKAAVRRQIYLQVIAKQLNTDISLEANDWLKPQGYYTAKFNLLSPDALKELANQAVNPATLDPYLAKESEHSGEQTAKAVRATLEKLALVANLEEAPEQTEP